MLAADRPINLEMDGDCAIEAKRQVNWGIRLGVSRLVYGRRRHGTRVLFNIAAPPVDPEWLIAEGVLLRRWRRRSNGSNPYAGVRLPPGTWRAGLAALTRVGGDPSTCSAEAFKTALESVRRSTGPQVWRTPPSASLLALLQYLEARGALDAVLDRHGPGGAADPERPGIPDLCLYLHNADDTISSVRFVEVKKPRERFALEQRQEILFLRSLGLRAGMVRICERKT